MFLCWVFIALQTIVFHKTCSNVINISYIKSIIEAKRAFFYRMVFNLALIFNFYWCHGLNFLRANIYLRGFAPEKSMFSCRLRMTANAETAAWLSALRWALQWLQWRFLLRHTQALAQLRVHSSRNPQRKSTLATAVGSTDCLCDCCRLFCISLHTFAIFYFFLLCAHVHPSFFQRISLMALECSAFFVSLSSLITACACMSEPLILFPKRTPIQTQPVLSDTHQLTLTHTRLQKWEHSQLLRNICRQTDPSTLPLAWVQSII